MVRSEAKLFNRPLTNASPAPVVSTAFTFTPPTLPLNSYKTNIISTRISKSDMEDEMLKRTGKNLSEVSTAIRSF